MEALAEELRNSILNGEKSHIKFTTIYPIMVNTGLVKNPRNRYVKAEVPFCWKIGNLNETDVEKFAYIDTRRGTDVWLFDR